MATKARVKRSAVNGSRKATDRLDIINKVVTKGSSCAAVSGSTVASASLAALKTSSGTARTSVVAHGTLVLQTRAAGKKATSDIADVEAKATTYMNAVNDVAQGDPAIIADAGLTARDGQAHVSSAAKVLTIKCEPGKQSKEAICSWPEIAGAGAYALRVNFIPTNPTKVQDLPSGTSRRRTIVAPTAGAQFLLSVAAIGSEGPGEPHPNLVMVRCADRRRIGGPRAR